MNLFSSNDKILIIGGDSDLILYALVADFQLNIDIERSPSQIVNINILRNQILKNIYTNDINNLSDEEKKNILNDFILLCCLNGTDYIPKFNSFELAVAWTIYIYHKQQNSFDFLFKFKNENEKLKFCINVDFLKELLPKEVQSDSAYYPEKDICAIVQFYSRRIENKKVKWVENRTENTLVHQLFIDDKIYFEKMINMPYGGRHRTNFAKLIRPLVEYLYSEFLRSQNLPFYSFENHIKDKIEQKILPNSEIEEKQQLTDYFKGLAWCIKYVGGTCINPNYMYPWSVSPKSTILNDYSYLEYDIQTTNRSDSVLSPLELFLTITPVSFCSELAPIEVKDPIHKNITKLKQIKNDCIVRKFGSITENIRKFVLDLKVIPNFVTSLFFTKDNNGKIISKPTAGHAMLPILPNNRFNKTQSFNQKIQNKKKKKKTITKLS